MGCKGSRVRIPPPRPMNQRVSSDELLTRSALWGSRGPLGGTPSSDPASIPHTADSRCPALPFEPVGSLVSETAVQPFAVVEAFDPVHEVQPRLVTGFV